MSRPIDPTSDVPSGASAAGSEDLELVPTPPPADSSRRVREDDTPRRVREDDEEEEDDGTAVDHAGDDDELSLAEASELVGVSTRALRDRVQRGSLPARKVTREGRVLSVVKRSDLLEIYGWMVAEGERKRQVEDSTGAARRRTPVEARPAGSEDTLGEAARQLRSEVDKLQRALVDVTAEMRLVREAHVRQREQDIRARAEHEREIQLLHERAAALADELRAQRSGDARTMLGRTPWEIVTVVLLLTAVVLALWVRFQGAEARRAAELRDLKQQVTEFLDEARTYR